MTDALHQKAGAREGGIEIGVSLDGTKASSAFEKSSTRG